MPAVQVRPQAENRLRTQKIVRQILDSLIFVGILEPIQ